MFHFGPGPKKKEYDSNLIKLKGTVGIVEDGDKATQTIAKGQYVNWKGNLYIALSTIPSGTTLSTTTNANLAAKSNGLGGDVASLSDQIGTLNTKTEKVDFTASCTEDASWQYLKCKKIGNLVTIFGRVGYVEIGQTRTKVLTIPNGYRPESKVYAPTTAKDGAGSAVVAYGMVTIDNTTGELSIENNTNGCYNAVNVTYTI